MLGTIKYIVAVRVYRRVFHYFRDKVYVVNKGGIIFVEFMMI